MSLSTFERAMVDFLIALEHCGMPSESERTPLADALMSRITTCFKQHDPELADLPAFDAEASDLESAMALFIDERTGELIDLNERIPHCVHGVPFVGAECVECEQSQQEGEVRYINTHCVHGAPFERDCEECDRIYWIDGAGKRRLAGMILDSSCVGIWKREATGCAENVATREEIDRIL